MERLHSVHRFNLIDDFNREALAMDIDLPLPAEQVQALRPV